VTVWGISCAAKCPTISPDYQGWKARPRLPSNSKPVLSGHHHWLKLRGDFQGSTTPSLHTWTRLGLRASISKAVMLSQDPCINSKNNGKPEHLDMNLSSLSRQNVRGYLRNLTIHFSPRLCGARAKVFLALSGSGGTFTSVCVAR
jgi:hypothetical protein